MIPAGINEERYAQCLESTTLFTRFGLADLTGCDVITCSRYNMAEVASHVFYSFGLHEF